MSAAGLKMLEQAAPQALAALVEHLQNAGDVVIAGVVQQHAPAFLQALLDGLRLAHGEGEQRGRAVFLADLGARFVMHVFETMEDASDEELQRVARRAVRLARMLLTEAEKAAA